MKVKKQKTSPAVASVLVALVGVLILGAGVFLIVLPQRKEAASLSKEIDATEQQIATARVAAARKPPMPIRTANLFKLVKAMPDREDMPGLLLQLNQTASDAGIVFDSIAPQTPATGTGFAKVPINLEFTGNFYDLNDFVYRLRSLVAVRGGTLYATGRLFTIDSIEFSEGVGGFPNIAAKVTLAAYVFGNSVPGAAAPPAPPAPATPTPPSADTLASGEIS